MGIHPLRVPVAPKQPSYRTELEILLLRTPKARSNPVVRPPSRSPAQPYPRQRPPHNLHGAFGSFRPKRGSKQCLQKEVNDDSDRLSEVE